MEFLYFPEDKSEYIPGIISILVIFVLSIFIVRLLMRASRKEVQHLEQQGYPAFYNENKDAIEKPQDEASAPKGQHVKAEGTKSDPDKKP
jgi:mannitol-specific phosphotransferase system IIBC component